MVFNKLDKTHLAEEYSLGYIASDRIFRDLIFRDKGGDVMVIAILIHFLPGADYCFEVLLAVGGGFDALTGDVREDALKPGPPPLYGPLDDVLFGLLVAFEIYRSSPAPG